MVKVLPLKAAGFRTTKFSYRSIQKDFSGSNPFLFKKLEKTSALSKKLRHSSELLKTPLAFTQNVGELCGSDSLNHTSSNGNFNTYGQ